MSKNILLNFFLIFLLIGVFIANLLLDVKLFFLVLLFLVILLCNFYNYVLKYKKILFVIILWFFIWWVIAFINIWFINSKLIFLNSYFNKTDKIDILFKINTLYKINDNYNIYTSKLISINKNKVNYNIDFLSYIPLNYKLKSWEILEWKVKLYNLKNLENFEYKYYMISKNIYFKSYINSFQKKSYIKPNLFYFYINKLRKKLLWIIAILYPKDEWNFLAWILLWSRQWLSLEIQQNFNNSWLTHLIAVSWFNITILIVFFGLLLRFFPSWLKIILITFFIVSFVALVWFWISVIRAAIMWLLAYYILMSWRNINILTTILITAFFIVLFSPFSLNYNISLHLSFLAVLWIVYTQWFFSKIFNFMPDFLAIKEAFVLTLAALSFSLPVIIFNFGQMSMFTILANLSVIWDIPIAMFLWFLSIIVYIVYNPLWWLLSYFTWIFLKWDIMMVNFFWTQNWAIMHFNIWEYSKYLEIVYYLTFVFIIIYFYEEKKETIF